MSYYRIHIHVQEKDYTYRLYDTDPPSALVGADVDCFHVGVLEGLVPLLTLRAHSTSLLSTAMTERTMVNTILSNWPA